MRRSASTKRPARATRSQTDRECLKEIDLFFRGKGRVHQTLRRIVKRLDKAGIAHAVAGGIAVNLHGHKRTTADVDFLITAEGFDEFCRLFVPRNYEQVPGRARRFADRKNQVMIDFLVTGRFPGCGQPGPIAFPDPADVTEVIGKLRVIGLRTLVELKLAARRFRDLGDVVELIRLHNLDDSFANCLHPSLHGAYTRCLEEKLREEELEARGESH